MALPLSKFTILLCSLLLLGNTNGWEPTKPNVSSTLTTGTKVIDLTNNGGVMWMLVFDDTVGGASYSVMFNASSEIWEAPQTLVASGKNPIVLFDEETSKYHSVTVTTGSSVQFSNKTDGLTTPWALVTASFITNTNLNPSLSRCNPTTNLLVTTHDQNHGHFWVYENFAAIFSNTGAGAAPSAAISGCNSTNYYTVGIQMTNTYELATKAGNALDTSLSSCNINSCTSAYALSALDYYSAEFYFVWGSTTGLQCAFEPVVGYNSVKGKVITSQKPTVVSIAHNKARTEMITWIDPTNYTVYVSKTSECVAQNQSMDQLSNTLSTVPLPLSTLPSRATCTPNPAIKPVISTNRQGAWMACWVCGTSYSGNDGLVHCGMLLPKPVFKVTSICEVAAANKTNCSLNVINVNISNEKGLSNLVLSARVTGPHSFSKSSNGLIIPNNTVLTLPITPDYEGIYTVTFDLSMNTYKPLQLSSLTYTINYTKPIIIIPCTAPPPYLCDSNGFYYYPGDVFANGTISGINATIFGSFIVSVGSYVILDNSSLALLGDFNIGGVLEYNYSALDKINISNCLIVTGELKIYVNNVTDGTEFAKANCFNDTGKITVIGQDCVTLTKEESRQAIIFRVIPGCGADNSVWNMLYLIPIGGTIFIILLLLIIFTKVNRVRRSIFPYRNKIDDFHTTSRRDTSMLATVNSKSSMAAEP